MFEIATAPDLRRAAELLDQAAVFADQEWTQAVNARNERNQAVHYYSREAIKFSAGGHLWRVLHQNGEDYSFFNSMYAAASHNLPEGSLNKWNDQIDRRPEEIRQLFRNAAQRLREKADSVPENDP